MDYKEKYLKYKTKYLQLKKKIIGGANCPQLGFHQHIGECVHDSLLMILLYSDNFSERIQTLFDSSNFRLEDCITEAESPFNKFFMPIQIETVPYSSFLDFSRYSKDYLKNIFERYQNEKLSFTENSFELSLSSRAERIWPVYAAPTKSITRTLPRTNRRDSINESLLCNFSLFNLTNINMLKDLTFKYTHNEHGMTHFHNLTAISIINYYLTNYRPPSIFGATSTSGTETKQFLSMRGYSLFEIFMIDELQNTQNISELHKILDEINKRLHELYGLINYAKNLLGISLSLGIKENLEASGHEVAFIKCNNVNKFYDNNGVYDIEIEEDFNTQEGPNVPSLVTYPDYYMKKGADLIKDFRWKDYLLDVIVNCRRGLTDLKIQNRDEIIKQINVLLNSFSALFTANDTIKQYLKDGRSGTDNKCGREYLEEYIIRHMNFIFINNISNEANKEKEYILANIRNILEVFTVYTNDRTYDILSKALEMIPEEFENVFFRLARFQNTTLLAKLIKDYKLPTNIKLQCIISIINDILEQPYEKINDELIKLLLTNIKQVGDISRYSDEFKGILESMKTKPYYRDYSKSFS